MKTLLVMDEHDYDPDWPEIRRKAVRGIIFIDGRLLMIEDSFREVKLPGGGMEPGENDMDTLIREVREETGYTVLPESIRPFGEIEEKRQSRHEPMIWHQYSRLYFCDVAPEQGNCEFTANEKKYGFHRVMYTLEEALEKNRRMIAGEGERPWNQREYRTLRILKEYLESNEAE